MGTAKVTEVILQNCQLDKIVQRVVVQLQASGPTGLGLVSRKALVKREKKRKALSPSSTSDSEESMGLSLAS